jgi:hypothetical protein
MVDSIESLVMEKGLSMPQSLDGGAAVLVDEN